MCISLLSRCCVRSAQNLQCIYRTLTQAHPILTLPSISCKQNCAFDGYNMFDTNTRLLSFVRVCSQSSYEYGYGYVCASARVVRFIFPSFFILSFGHSVRIYSLAFIQIQWISMCHFFTLSFAATFLVFAISFALSLATHKYTMVRMCVHYIHQNLSEIPIIFPHISLCGTHTQITKW